MTEVNPPIMPAGGDQELLALRFALGLLEGAELGSAIDRYRDDPGFAAMVDRIEARLAEEAGPPPAGADHADLWQRIEGSLGVPRRSGAPAPVPIASNDDVAPPARTWRTAGIAAMAAALTFAALWFASGGIGPRSVPSGPAPTMQAISVAQINAKDEPIIALAYDASTGSLKARYMAPADPQRVPELWLIGADGKPVSLGFVRPGAATLIVIPDELRQSLINGATIAISLEQPSETRHAAPAGPILGTAKVSAI